MLQGQIKGENKSFKEKYEKIKWSFNKKHVNAFLEGKTGFPIIDACVRDINNRNFMHNRGRMIVASFLAKDLHLDFKWIENWFATRLVDYDPISNSGGVQWSTGNGTDDTLLEDEGTAVIDNGSGANSTEEKEEDDKDEID